MTAYLHRGLPPDLRLGIGCHARPEDGLCLLEAVAWVAGEPHSDSPGCVSVSLATFGRALNDVLEGRERQLLMPFVPRLVGTRSDEVRRARTLVDGFVREIAPCALEAAEWRDLAEILRRIPRIVDQASAGGAALILGEACAEAKWRYRAAQARSPVNAVTDARAASRTADRAATLVEDAADARAAAAATSYTIAAADAADARRGVISATLRVFERAIALEAGK